MSLNKLVAAGVKPGPILSVLNLVGGYGEQFSALCFLSLFCLDQGDRTWYLSGLPALIETGTVFHGLSGFVQED